MLYSEAYSGNKSCEALVLLAEEPAEFSHKLVSFNPKNHNLLVLFILVSIHSVEDVLS